MSKNISIKSYRLYILAHIVIFCKKKRCEEIL